MLKILAIKNFAFLAGAEVVSRLGVLLLSVIIARQLGVTDFGQLGVASAITSYFLLFSDFGLSTLGMKEVARQPDKASQWGSNILYTQLLIGLLLLLLLGGALLVVPMDAHLRLVTFLFGLSIVPAAINMTYLLQSQDRMLAHSLVKSLSQLLYVAVSFVGLYFINDIVVLPIAQLLTGLGGSAIVFLLLKRYIKFTIMPFDKELVRHLLKHAWPFIVSALLVQIYWNSDVIIIEFMQNTDQAGYYSAAFKLLVLVFSVISLANAALFPTLSRLAGDTTKYLNVLKKYARYLGIAAVPASFAGVLLAPQLVSFIYGPGYEASILPLQILSVYPLIKFLNITFEATLITHDQIKKVTMGSFWAAVVNVGLTILLLPVMGIAGAAVATIAAELVSISILMAYYYRLMGYNILVDYGFKQIIAASFMGVVLVFSSAWQWPLLAILLVGGATYAVVLLLIGGIPKEDVRQAFMVWPAAAQRLSWMLDDR